MTSNLDPKALFEWCRIPAEELEGHPSIKIGIKILPTAGDVHRYVASMMAEEVQHNNASNQPTRWILPCGPTKQYAYFIDKVNSERISLRNVHNFHMDDCLDWQGRPLPLTHPFSYQGWMKRYFYDLIRPDLNIPENQRHFPDVYDIERISREKEPILQ